MKKLYTNTTEQHNKFWSYEKLTPHTIRYEWGRIGGSSDNQTKEYGSSFSADKEIDSKIRDKVRKGYKEVTAEKLNTETEIAKTLGSQYKIAKVSWVRKEEKFLYQIPNYDPNHHVLVEIMNSWSKDTSYLLLNKRESQSLCDVEYSHDKVTFSALGSAQPNFADAVRKMLRTIAQTVQAITVKFAAAGVRVLSIGNDEEVSASTEVLSALRQDLASSASDQVVMKFAAVGTRVLDI